MFPPASTRSRLCASWVSGRRSDRGWPRRRTCALLLVERGEAPAGIVCATDAAVSRAVSVAGVFPDGSHDVITYPFAMIKGGDTDEARGFLAFL